MGGRMDTSQPLRIGLIASARHPIREPFAGGLEMHTYALSTRLRQRGHDVRVFASADSDPDLGVVPVCGRSSCLDLSDAARQDSSMPAEGFMTEHHAYLHLMLRLADAGFDVVHNNSLHYLPVAMAGTVGAPVVTTLHTPPTPWLESALTARPPCDNLTLVAVSSVTAQQWSAKTPVRTVIPNGIDLHAWRFHPTADPRLAIWFGRVVPEKGAHLAVQAAHAAGLRILLVGPIGSRAYFEQEVLPLLEPQDRYAGHLRHHELAQLVGSASVALCTPCWEEPYGLVIAEALACGTPVAGFARGALPELLDDATGRLAPPGDVAALAQAVSEACSLDRHACRKHAESHCSVEVMVDRYERLYTEVRAA